MVSSFRNNGPRQLLSNRQNQDFPSEFLTPPKQQQPSKNPRLFLPIINPNTREGKLLMNLLTSTPAPIPLSTTPEPPGFFARLFGWTNAVSPTTPIPTTTTPQPQPQQQTQTNNYQSRNYQDDDSQQAGQWQNTYDARKQSLPHKTYSNEQLPHPPFPPNGQSYSPPSQKGNCNDCNSIPWTPINKANAYDDQNNYSGTNNGLPQNSNNKKPINQQNNLPSNNVKVYAPTNTVPLKNKPNTNCQDNNKISKKRQPDYPVPIKIPIQNIYMFAGALPPIYRETKFHPQTRRIENDIFNQTSKPIDQVTDASNTEQLTTVIPYFGINRNNVTASNIGITASGRDSVSNSVFHPYVINNQPENVTYIYSQSTEPVIYIQNSPTVNSLSGEVFTIVNSPVLNYSTTETPIQSTIQSTTTVQQPTIQSTTTIQPPIIQSTSTIQQPITQSTSTVRQSTIQSTTTVRQPTIQSTTTVQPQIIQSTTAVWQPAIQPTTTIQVPTIQSTTTVEPPIIQSTTTVQQPTIQSTSTTQQPIIQSTYYQVQTTPSSRVITTTTTQKSNNNINNSNRKNKTEQPLRDAIYESYLEFLKRNDNSTTKEKPKSLFNNNNGGSTLKVMNAFPDKIHDSYSIDDDNDYPTSRRQTPKRNKLFQIIIPYTSQYKPSPFKLPHDFLNQQDSHSDETAISPTILTSSKEFNTNYENQLSKNLESMEKLLNSTVRIAKPANTSIDHVKLQKNIDNWTILEYSTTKLPGSFSPQLTQSKSIPDEYLTTTEPTTSTENTYDDDDDDFSEFFENDLEHVGSSSSVTNIKYSPFKTERPSTYNIEKTSNKESSINMNDQSSKQLSVSMASLNNERVYVVTPQTFTSHSNNNNNNNNNNSNNKSDNNNNSYNNNENNHSGIRRIIKNDMINSTELNSIEKAYQVLPEAVNNLEVASTGPAQNGLWGIMEHDQYASVINNSTSKIPVLHSGHSKVSRGRQ
ncbi:hypothetical protein HCN44_010606 [Aphidius gifuensis]|uniref:Uncharacterized protein n=2 Tax=Aphidius gifuensis TaxID=684658 RepID=A0A835CT04_APHGI|nr:hypothetical protein HCN44_010606 [Aphidius gifuensis]